MDKNFYILSGCFITLMVLDIITTTYILAHGGYEGNPFLVNIVGNVGSHVAVKGVVCAIIFCLAVFAEHIRENGGTVVMAAVSSFFLLPVVSNTIQIYTYT
jgi:hypothetical protein